MTCQSVRRTAVLGLGVGGGVGSSENSNVPVVLSEIQQTVHTDNCVSCVLLVSVSKTKAKETDHKLFYRFQIFVLKPMNENAGRSIVQFALLYLRQGVTPLTLSEKHKRVYILR